jgi:hypothetical protein
VSWHLLVENIILYIFTSELSVAEDSSNRRLFRRPDRFRRRRFRRFSWLGRHDPSSPRVKVNEFFFFDYSAVMNKLVCLSVLLIFSQDKYFLLKLIAYKFVKLCVAVYQECL